MHRILGALLLALTIPSHAASNTSGPHGGIGAARGQAEAKAAAATSAARAAMANNGMPGAHGNGGSYWSPDMHASVVDGYQPWSEAEMRQFQKE